MARIAPDTSNFFDAATMMQANRVREQKAGTSRLQKVLLRAF